MWLYDLKKKKKAVKSNVLLYLNTALQGITCVRAQFYFNWWNIKPNYQSLHHRSGPTRKLIIA